MTKEQKKKIHEICMKYPDLPSDIVKSIVEYAILSPRTAHDIMNDWRNCSVREWCLKRIAENSASPNSEGKMTVDEVVRRNVEESLELIQAEREDLLAEAKSLGYIKERKDGK